MKLIPFSVIKAAKENDLEAAEKIRKHYDSCIGSRCLQSYTDENGTRHTYVDEDLRYLAEIALYAAIFRFQFTDPPDDFEP